MRDGCANPPLRFADPRPWSLLCALILALCTPACGTESTAVEPVGDPPDASVDTTDTGAEPDVAEDWEPVDTGHDAGAPWAPCVDGGEPGCPCADNSDCYSGFCVPTEQGLQCTKACETACPAGWTCALLDQPDGDVVYLCVSLFTNLCRPCETGEDCDQLGDTGGYCIPSDDGSGSFCGGPCGALAACPDGYDCVEVDGLAGQPVSQCQPESGQCTCNQKAVKDEASTSCTVTNGHGSCAGTRQCHADGLSACDGATPSEEICDGEDNNCDGDVDEGAPDTDSDGIVDCLDPDLDGDQIPNDTDLCPDIADPDQTDTDGDGSGDLCDDDDDGDGAPDDEDCAPLDPLVGPGLIELCDEMDNNCDDLVDEGCQAAEFRASFACWAVTPALGIEVPAGSGWRLGAIGGASSPAGDAIGGANNTYGVRLGLVPTIVAP